MLNLSFPVLLFLGIEYRSTNINNKPVDSNAVVNGTLIKEREIEIETINKILSSNFLEAPSKNLRIKTNMKGNIIIPKVPKLKYASEKRPLFARAEKSPIS